MSRPTSTQAIPKGAAGVIAEVHGRWGLRPRLLLKTVLASFAAAVLLAQSCPDFCARHAVLVSAAICLGLAAINVIQRRSGGATLICDGRWLACGSWLLGVLIDLEALAAVYSRGSAERGGIREVSLWTRQRELFRLNLAQWEREDVRSLIAALLQSNPQLELDSPTRLWLQQPETDLHLPRSARKCRRSHIFTG